MVHHIWEMRKYYIMILKYEKGNSKTSKDYPSIELVRLENKRNLVVFKEVKRILVYFKSILGLLKRICQNDISVSTSGRTITIEHDDNDHSFSTGIVNISANGNASGTTVSFTPSGSTARFLSSINASGSTVTFNRTATTSASITISFADNKLKLS